MDLWEINKMPYGKERRELFVEWLKVGRYQYAGLCGIPVNHRGQCNDRDQDLQYLLKKGVITRIRPVSGFAKPGKKNSTGRQTYLVLT